MRKYISTIITTVLVFFMTACNSTVQSPPPGTTQQNTTGAVSYKDGTYEGEGDPWEHGKESATVVINGGKISGITLRRLDTNGQEVDYSQWTGKEVNGQKYPNLKQFREDMAGKMVAAQTYNVDTISGATVSTGNWKVAVQRALEKAKT